MSEIARNSNKLDIKFATYVFYTKYSILKNGNGIM